ncbi:hypothetical protein V866_000905 [Kwoniella sp. B9012]|uniref:uncharacterized protein n=1 Tax=Kwoniella mangroviensis CBS 8507 TaxID=1296122 RepID=UPI00080D3012|nr:hypothetical protein I204_05146 [Kwoniella mangroviensis CBS 8886]
MLNFGQNGGGVQMEMANLKAAPVLNPNYGMVIKYLDCLNRLADYLLSRGATGLAPWLMEVQWLLTSLQKRTYHRMPLTPVERTSIISFASYWRRRTEPPYLMGRPEAQLVLIALTEFAMH